MHVVVRGRGVVVMEVRTACVHERVRVSVEEGARRRR